MAVVDEAIGEVHTVKGLQVCFGGLQHRDDYTKQDGRVWWEDPLCVALKQDKGHFSHISRKHQSVARYIPSRNNWHHCSAAFFMARDLGFEIYPPGDSQYLDGHQHLH